MAAQFSWIRSRYLAFGPIPGINTRGTAVSANTYRDHKVGAGSEHGRERRAASGGEEADNLDALALLSDHGLQKELQRALDDPP